MSEDRPQYAATKTPPDPIPTNAEIAERLRAVAHEMRSLGGMMDYVGGFHMIGFCGRSLVDMAQRPTEWAHEIESEAK